MSTLVLMTNFCIGHTDKESFSRLVNSMAALRREVHGTLMTVCIQGGSALPDEINLSAFDEILYCNSRSISEARNALIKSCLETAGGEQACAMFLDDDCSLGLRARCYIKTWVLRHPDKILVGRPPWGVPLPSRGTRPFSSVWLWQSYLWCSIIPVSYLELTRFDTRIGPGSQGGIMAGEDFIFMADLAARGKILNFVYANSFIVSHPPRPKNLDKAIRYSSGHCAALFHRCLSRKDGIYGAIVRIAFISAFLISAIFRIIKMRNKESVILFIRRLSIFSQTLAFNGFARKNRKKHNRDNT